MLLVPLQTVNHFQVIVSFTTDSQKTRFADFMPSTFYDKQEG